MRSGQGVAIHTENGQRDTAGAVKAQTGGGNRAWAPVVQHPGGEMEIRADLGWHPTAAQATATAKLHAPQMTPERREAGL